MITDAHGTTYEPFTEGGVMGFKATSRDGRVEYLYLNPSSSSDDGVPNVFLYHGPTGDPGQDGAVIYVDLFEEAPALSQLRAPGSATA